MNSVSIISNEPQKRIYTKLKFTASDKTNATVGFVSQNSKTGEIRGVRQDDKDLRVLDNRIKEFKEKTIPVIETYQKRGLIVSVKATGDREEVYTNVVESLMHFALQSNQ